MSTTDTPSPTGASGPTGITSAGSDMAPTALASGPRGAQSPDSAMATSATASGSGSSGSTAGRASGTASVDSPGWTHISASKWSSHAAPESDTAAGATSNEPSKRNELLGVGLIGLALVALFAIAYPIGQVSRNEFAALDVLWIALAVALVVVAVVLIKTGIALARGTEATDLDEGLGDEALGTSLLASALPALAVGAIVTTALWRHLGPAPDEVVDAEAAATSLANEVAVAIGIVAVIATVFVHRQVSDRGSDRSSDPDRANPWQFGELSARRDYLEASYLAYCCNRQVAPDPSGVAACTDARIQVEQIALELDVPTIVLEGAVCVGSSGYAKKRRVGSSDKWLLGTGFVELWQRLHAAEAALLTQRPLEQRLSYAGYDGLRLSGCEIAGVEDLKNDLDLAIKTLDEIQKEKQSEASEERAAKVQRATEVLISVHKAIDDYRDQSRAGLARTRVHLIMAGLVTAILAFVLLDVAILDDVKPVQVIAGGAYFLVGAVAGLIWQLRQSGSTIRSGEDDFGLDHARLVYVPVLSGLAGVGGVLLMAMLYPTLNVVLDVTVVPPVETDVPSLEEIFNLYTNRFGLVVAAVFGLTPDLLINRLQSQADQYKAELAATSPQTRSDAAVPTALAQQLTLTMDERLAEFAEARGLQLPGEDKRKSDGAVEVVANGKTDTGDGAASNQVTEETEVLAVRNQTEDGQAGAVAGAEGAETKD